MDSIVSFNINKWSREKLSALVSSCMSDLPICVGLQEVKRLSSPSIPGYNSISNISKPIHGVTTLVRDDVKTSSISCDHNIIVVKIVCDHDTFIFINIYNPWKDRHDWRQLLSVIKDLDETKVVVAGDFNFSDRDREFEDICLFFSSLDIIPCPGESGATCRGSTRPDHCFVNKDLIARSRIGCQILGSDHLPLLISFNLNSSIHKALFDQPVIAVSRCHKRVLIDIIDSIDIFSIDRLASDNNDFFVALELAILHELCNRDLVKFKDPRPVLLRNYARQDVKRILCDAIKRSDRLKYVKILTSCNSSGFSFCEVASALSKAEEGFCLPQLVPHSCRARIRCSLEFSAVEVKERIDKLDIKKSTGISCINARLLKLTPHSWHVILACRFNSISVSEYPIFFRVRKLVGVPKSDGTPRPIAILSAIAKLYDAGLADRLQDASSHFLPPSQTAYQKNVRGCEENVFIAKCLSQKYPDLIMLFSDFSKAFNSMPNKVIEKSLDELGISDSLIAAVLDSIEFYAVADVVSGEFLGLVRGQPQGGCQSGFIFLLCIRLLSLELDSFPKLKPLYLGNKPISHGGFADDCVGFALCLRDALILCRILISWSVRSGMPLNLSKCKYISNGQYILPFKRCNSYKYLGVTISLKNSKFNFSRPFNTNSIITCKVSDTFYNIPNSDSLCDIIRSFNMGPFGLHICYSEIFRISRTVGDVTKFFNKWDSHWIQILKKFCNISDEKIIISTNRIAAEFNLAFYRCGPSIIRFAADFVDYISQRPSDSYASLALSEDLDCCLDLKFARFFLHNKALSIPKSKISTMHWGNCRKSLRTLVGPIFLSIDSNKKSEIDSLRILILQKRFCEAAVLARSINP